MIFVKERTARDERRRGIRALIITVVVLGAMFALWWLDVTHNTEGDPGDPELLPTIALVPLVIASWHFAWARYLGRHDSHPDTADHAEEERRAA